MPGPRLTTLSVRLLHRPVEGEADRAWPHDAFRKATDFVSLTRDAALIGQIIGEERDARRAERHAEARIEQIVIALLQAKEIAIAFGEIAVRQRRRRLKIAAEAIGED